jgi:sulfate permease, SulP family
MTPPAPPSAPLTHAGRAAWWRALFPPAEWLRSYERGWFRGDLAAGFTLAAYLLPAGLGDASLAGLPPQAGLYACLFSGLAFWLFCSSRHTAVSVTSAISLLIGSSLGELAVGDTARFGTLAAATALLVAGLALAAWLVRAGVIVNFISETVLIGFKGGVALYLASTQLPKLCGFPGSHGGFEDQVVAFISHLGDVHAASFALGAGALVVLILGRRVLPGVPMALFVVIGAILAASFSDLAGHGVKLLGNVPQGLPPFGLPDVHRSDFNTLLPLALACFLLGAVETAAVGRTFAQKHGQRLDSNQELLALAGANLAAGLGHGFPVSGGMSQSLVNETAGARTPLSGFVAALVMLVVTAFCSGLLRNLPQPVLAAVVLAAVASLIHLAAWRRLWRAHRREFVVAGVALLGVLGLGLLRGVLLGVILSLIMLLRRTTRPHVAFLGRIPGTRRFTDLARHPDNERVPGLLIFRVEASLLYFNVEHVRDTVWTQCQTAAGPIQQVLGDLSNSPYVDMAGAAMLADLHRDLTAAGIAFHLVEAHSGVRDLLRAEGLEPKLGPFDRAKTVADAVDDFLNHQATPASEPPRPLPGSLAG